MPCTGRHDPDSAGLSAVLPATCTERQTPITPDEPDVPPEPPRREEGEPEIPDQPLGPPADLDEEEAPLPGLPETEPPQAD